MIELFIWDWIGYELYKDLSQCNLLLSFAYIDWMIYNYICMECYCYGKKHENYGKKQLKLLSRWIWDKMTAWKIMLSKLLATYWACCWKFIIHFMRVVKNIQQHATHVVEKLQQLVVHVVKYQYDNMRMLS